jgi:hypothetical protein
MTAPRRPRVSASFPPRHGIPGSHQPLTERLLHALGAHPDFADAVLGDLAEERARRAEQAGPMAARWWHAREALRAVPHLLWNAVRHGGSTGRARAAAVLAPLVLLPLIALVALLVRDAPPARLVVEDQRGGAAYGGIVVNTKHPVQLAVHAVDSSGRALPSTDVRFALASGTPLRVTSGGVVTCYHPGDAEVRASAGAVVTNVLVRCRPVREVLTQSWVQLVAGGGAQELSFVALDPAGRRVDTLTGELRVQDSTIATLRGIRVYPRSPGHTVVIVRIGDAEAGIGVGVYESVRTLDGLRPDQRYVVTPVRLARGDTISWSLPKGLFWLHYSRGSRAQPVPRIAVSGPIMCMHDFGPGAGPVGCLVRGPGALLRLSHPGTSPPDIAGSLTVERPDDP